MATRRTYRSSQGKSIDLGTLLLQNETVRAVGNMGVNARGDRIDNRGAVVDSKVQQSKRQYNKQIGPQDTIPQASRAPVADDIPPAPVAPDPYELQKSNAKEAEAFKEKRRAEKATAKAAKASKPKVVKTPVVDESFLNIEPIQEPVVEVVPGPVAVAPAPAKGLADAIARAKTIKQEQLKTPRQIAQEKSGVKKI
tara:strand:- start:92 stop:679 length:588 start_codon:yes stop_codon:yes gene_type:complete